MKHPNVDRYVSSRANLAPYSMMRVSIFYDLRDYSEEKKYNLNILQ